MLFKPDEAMHLVLFGETDTITFSVLSDTSKQIVRHAGIERSVSLRGENVDEIGVHDEWNIS